jgi:hypothetical protein
MSAKSLPIFAQLAAGIRFLDIRFGINGNEIMIYHGVSLLLSISLSD